MYSMYITFGITYFDDTLIQFKLYFMRFPAFISQSYIFARTQLVWTDYVTEYVPAKTKEYLSEILQFKKFPGVHGLQTRFEAQ